MTIGVCTSSPSANPNRHYQGQFGRTSAGRLHTILVRLPKSGRTRQSRPDIWQRAAEARIGNSAARGEITQDIPGGRTSAARRLGSVLARRASDWKPSRWYTTARPPLEWEPARSGTTRVGWVSRFAPEISWHVCSSAGHHRKARRFEEDPWKPYPAWLHERRHNLDGTWNWLGATHIELLGNHPNPHVSGVAFRGTRGKRSGYNEAEVDRKNPTDNFSHLRSLGGKTDCSSYRSQSAPPSSRRTVRGTERHLAALNCKQSIAV